MGMLRALQVPATLTTLHCLKDGLPLVLENAPWDGSGVMQLPMNRLGPCTPAFDSAQSMSPEPFETAADPPERYVVMAARHPFVECSQHREDSEAGTERWIGTISHFSSKGPVCDLAIQQCLPGSRPRYTSGIRGELQQLLWAMVPVDVYA